jgi:Flp pilus assembly protein TadG
MVAMTPRPRRRLGGRDEGSELIELAIVLPLLLLVFAAIIDFGFLFQRYEAVTNAAREGARLAVLPGYQPSDVQARVVNYLAASGLTGAPAPTVAYSNQTLPSGASISVVTVTVTYPANLAYLGPIASLVGGTQPGSIMLRAVSVMRTEAAAAAGGS